MVQGGIPLIGGDGSAGCAGAAFVTNQNGLLYTITPADAVAGKISIFAGYTNGTAHIGEANLIGVVSGTQGYEVNVTNGVACAVMPETNAVCPGGEATFCAIANGGTTPYVYNWTGPADFTSSNACITVTNVQAVNAGAYRVTVTDYYGCTNTCSGQLILNPVPVCAINPPSATACFGPTNCVDFTVTPSGGSSPWTIVCSGPGVSSTNVTAGPIAFRACATNIGTNFYACTITDAEGCSSSCQAAFIVNPNPVCSIVPAEMNICLGACATMTVTPAGGRAPYVVVLSLGGTRVATNITSTSATFTNCPTTLGLNNFVATIIDANGCITSCSATVVVNPNPICSITPATANICLGACATMTVTPSNGRAPYVFILSRAGVAIATNVSSGAVTFTNCPTALGPNNYVVTVIDANGCAGSCPATVVVNPNPVCTITPLTTNICLGACAVMAVTPNGGQAPYIVVLSRSGVPIATNITSTGAFFTNCPTTLGANNYVITITDANGCASSCAATVVVNPNPICTITPPVTNICLGACARMVVTPASGTPPYLIVLSRAGVPIATNVTSTAATFTNCPTSIGSNTYFATITDSMGCSGVCRADVIVNPNPVCTVAPAATNICLGSCATMNVTPSGGRAPYVVVLTQNGNAIATNVTSTTATFINCPTSLGTNVYLAVVTDANGCVSGPCPAVITVNPNPICTVTPMTTNICLGACAQMAVTPSGGQAPYTVVLSRSGAPIATNITSGPALFTNCPTAVGSNNYALTVIDANGCAGSCSASVVVNPNPVCTISPPVTNICLGACARMVVTPASGTAPYVIVLSRSGVPIATNVTSTSAAFTNCPTALGSNTYVATITDAMGCMGSCRADVIVNANPICSIAPPTAELCFGVGNCVDYVVTPNGGQPPYRIIWSGPTGTLATNITSSSATFRVCADAVGTRVYSALVADNSGCTTFCTATNIVNPNPICSILPDRTNICAGGCAALQITPGSGTPPYSIVLSGPAGPIATNVMTGTCNAGSTDPRVDHIYDDGYVRVDSAGNGGSCADCTWYWGYDNASQVPGDGYIYFHCTQITGNGVVSITDKYSLALNGQPPIVPPIAPYQGTFDGPGPVISSAPIRISETIFTVCPTNPGPNVYSATVTDSRGCISSCSATILMNPNPVCAIAPETQEVCIGASATFTATVNGGTPPFTVSWTGPGGVTLLGPSITLSNAQSADAGVYIATVLDSQGCTTSCQAQLRVRPCAPDIEVTKEVACLLPEAACGNFAKIATGVRGAQCPAFCYRVVIRNVSPDVPIVSLSVNDPVLGGDISALFGLLPLAPGESRTALIKPVVHCANVINTVVATGRSADGLVDVDQDSAEARVLTIGIGCDLTLRSSFNMDSNSACLVLPESAPFEFVLTLKNTGTSGLDVVALHGLPSLVDCVSGEPVPLPALPIHLEPNGSAVISGCASASCPSGADYNVSVLAVADDADGAICVNDETGRPIRQETSCRACIRCEEPVTCRVTGGGVLMPNTSDQSCIRVDTAIFPFQTADGLTVSKITHGGQLGAPFSQMDCGEILGNSCIRGQWQHTRHYEGRSKPRDVIDMKFHSTNPKGVFDSLNCACLGCCDPETGAFITPIVVGGICNPDDKVCGPAPRPSPANAIIFSGVGSLTPEDDANGPRASRSEWVIFRVYIEDRSEPGGFHPKGSVQPADIYCFQAWKTGIRVSKKPDYSTVSTAFRQALGRANCEFLLGLQSGAIPIGTLPPPLVNGVAADIQDCGPMQDGNHQIHPATGASCE